jgi:hypothetical protein
MLFVLDDLKLDGDEVPEPEPSFEESFAYKFAEFVFDVLEFAPCWSPKFAR